MAAIITNPPPGAGFPGSTMNFTWTAGEGLPVDWYGLVIGSGSPQQPCREADQCTIQAGPNEGQCEDAPHDLYVMDTSNHTGDDPRSQKVTGLPNNGQFLFVRLYTNYIHGSDHVCYWRDYVYAAFGP